MSTAVVSVTVPASGEGPVASIAALVGVKTVTLTGRFVGPYTLLASHDDATFVPVLSFNSDGLESVKLTLPDAYKSVRVRVGANASGLVSVTVAGTSSPGENLFAALATFLAGAGGGSSPVFDTYALFPATGLEEGVNLICEGGLVGTILVEGSNDGAEFNPLGTFQGGAGPRPLVGLPAPLEFTPLSTDDRVRYLRFTLQGQVASNVVITVGGRIPATGGGAGTPLQIFISSDTTTYQATGALSPSALGPYSLSAGYSLTNLGERNVVLGNTLAVGTNSQNVVIGYNSTLSGNDTIANVMVGRSLTRGSQSSSGVQVGDILATGDGSDFVIQIGRQLSCGNSSGATVLIGLQSSIGDSSVPAIAIGSTNTTTGTSCALFGFSLSNPGSNNILLMGAGSSVGLLSHNSVVAGIGCVVGTESQNATVVGSGNTVGATSPSVVVVGTGSSVAAASTQCTLVGPANSAEGASCSLFGTTLTTVGTSSTLVGSNLSNPGSNNVLLMGAGSSVAILSHNSIVGGFGCTLGVGSPNAVLFGSGSTIGATSPDVVVIGDGDTVSGNALSVVAVGNAITTVAAAGQNLTSVVALGNTIHITGRHNGADIGSKVVAIGRNLTVGNGDGTGTGVVNVVAAGCDLSVGDLANNNIVFGNAVTLTASSIRNIVISSLGGAPDITGNRNVLIGEAPHLGAGVSDCVIVGSAGAFGSASIGVGSSQSVAINGAVGVNSVRAVAVGYQSAVSSARSIAVGESATVDAGCAGSAAYGAGAHATSAFEVIFDGNSVGGDPGILLFHVVGRLSSPPDPAPDLVHYDGNAAVNPLDSGMFLFYRNTAGTRVSQQVKVQAVTGLLYVPV